MASRLLAVKIGNSNITFGLFEQTRLLHVRRAQTETKTADEYATLLDDFFNGLAPPPDDGAWAGAAIVSVVPPLTAVLQQVCRRRLGVDPVVVGPKTKSGIAIRYDDVRELGADRLVAAVAAKARYGTPVIVLDFGTATTFNVVNRAGEFVGGAIAPGLELSADALHQSTAQLPRVDLAIPPAAIARNTINAMQSGILLGYAGMVDGMVGRMRGELGEPGARVIATGGLAPVLAPLTKVIEQVDSDLILDGLRIIFELNTSG